LKKNGFRNNRIEIEAGVRGTAAGSVESGLTAYVAKLAQNHWAD
jgi:hypothetical protein